MEPNQILFHKNTRLVEILTSGQIEFNDLYSEIREWESELDNLDTPAVIEGAGNITLPDGSKTTKCMILINNWHLSANHNIAVVGGYVTALDEERKPRHPIIGEARSKIQLLHEVNKIDDFRPTEAQIQYALKSAEVFSDDWEIDTDEKVIKRKKDASQSKHSVFALYWYLKNQWLRDPNLTKFHFPLKGLPFSPGKQKDYDLFPTWKINDEDLAFLTGGRLKDKDGKTLVKQSVEKPKKEAVPETYKVDEEELKFKVTIGIVTATESETKAVLTQIDTAYTVHGGHSTYYTVGIIPALGGEEHTVAVLEGGMGNLSSGVRSTQMIHDFPNLSEVFMVGIAGAIPRPDKVDKHVRLGDVVISDEKGVVKYDFIKLSAGGKQSRWDPRAPSQKLLNASRHVASKTSQQSEKKWLENYEMGVKAGGSKRPPSTKDVLYDSSQPPAIINHPKDPDRKPGEPKIHFGTIASGDTLVADPQFRDQLRDELNVIAVEMEGAGIAEATQATNTGYLVVRGTTDYCDGNKNNAEKGADVWKGYAALIAASFMKAVLENIHAIPIVIPKE